MLGEKLVKLTPEQAARWTEIGLRIARTPVLQYARPPAGLPVLRLPPDVAAYLRTTCAAALDDPREHAYVLALSTKNRLLSAPYLLAIGAANSCDVCPREVYRFALVAGASAIILAHTHPSGDCTPSPQDKTTTTRVQAAGTILGVELLDHLILAGAHRTEETATYYSFREAGLL